MPAQGIKEKVWPTPYLLPPSQPSVDFAMEILQSISLAEHDVVLLDLQTSLSQPSPQQPPPGGTSPNHHLRIFMPFLKSLLDDLKQLTTYQQKILFRFLTLPLFTLTLRLRILFQCALVSPSLLRGVSFSSSSSLLLTPSQDSLLTSINTALSSVPIDDIAILLKKYSASIDPKFAHSPPLLTPW
jgi:hypothetical protein